MNQLTDNESLILGSYAAQLRDIADQDYIAARMSYRASLPEPFLWQAEQALEKYMKATCLYNQVTCKNISHGLNALIKLINETIVSLDIPGDSLEFITLVDYHANNRYLDYNQFVSQSINDLDAAIWFVRRYCQNWKAVERYGFVARDYCMQVIHPGIMAAPKLFRVTGGYLERVIHGRNSIQRQELLLNNQFFGNEDNPNLPNSWASFHNSAAKRYIGADEILKRYIRISNEPS